MQPYLELASLRITTTIPLSPRLHTTIFLEAMAFMAYIALCGAALSAVLALLHWVYRWRPPKCTGTLPPGSMGFPIIGETLQFFAPNPSCGLSPFVSDRVKRYGSMFRT